MLNLPKKNQTYIIKLIFLIIYLNRSIFYFFRKIFIALKKIIFDNFII
jgi:hypothetical protein